MSLSNFAENLMLDWAFSTGTSARPTAWFVALHTADPTDDGTVGEIIVANDADYIRKTLGASGLAAAGGGQSLSQVAVSFTPAAGAAAYTVTHVSIWDASTVGNCLMVGAVAVPRTIDNANPFVINSGDLIAALD
jgi:hypothetical protein